MTIITDLLVIDHLIYVFCYFTVFTLGIQTPQLLTILHLKFERPIYYPPLCLKQPVDWQTV